MTEKKARKLKPVERKVSANDKATISGVKAFTPKERREAAAVVAAAEGLAKKYAAAVSNSHHPITGENYMHISRAAE